MTLAVDIAISAPGWKAAVHDPEEILRRAADAAWRAAGEGAGELSILLSDDEEVRGLNRDYRGKDRPTNVLSFPAEDAGGPGRPRLLGDVVLSLGTLRREAASQSKPLEDHLCHLAVHGILHLLGYDHESETQAEAMEALETEILDSLGIADPYAVLDDLVG